MIKNFSLENEEILNQQRKEFIERYNTPYTNEQVELWENYLNTCFEDARIEGKEEVVKGIHKVSTIEVPITAGVGNRIETHVYNAIKEGRFHMGIKTLMCQNPNGEMKFPDYEWDNIYVDSKAVICKPLVRKDNYSKNYNNGLGDRDEITEIVSRFVHTGNLDKKSSALIAISYYSTEGEQISWLKVKLIPFLFYISTYKDEHDFAIKQCTDGKVKNANVQGRLNIKEGSCEIYLDKLRRTIRNIESR